MGPYWEAQGGQLARFRVFWGKKTRKKLSMTILINFLLEVVLNYVFEGKIYIRSEKIKYLNQEGASKFHKKY